MPTERDLLKKLIETLSKQPENKPNQDDRINKKEPEKKTEQGGIIPLRSIEDIFGKDNETNKAE